VDPLLYQTNGALNEAAARDEIGTLKLRYKTPEGALSQKQDEALSSSLTAAPSVDVQWQLAVAETAVILGQIKGLEGSSLTAAQSRAEAALGEDPLGLRAEFVSLLNRLTAP
jgi:Ca-activated chloride channel family protein